jgi:hypothetical protein
MSGKAELFANHRRSCFDKLSTNGLCCKQDFWAGSLFTFCLTTYPMKIAEQFLVILPFAERSRSQLFADEG